MNRCPNLKPLSQPVCQSSGDNRGQSQNCLAAPSERASRSGGLGGEKFALQCTGNILVNRVD